MLLLSITSYSKQKMIAFLILHYLFVRFLFHTFSRSSKCLVGDFPSILEDYRLLSLPNPVTGTYCKSPMSNTRRRKNFSFTLNPTLVSTPSFWIFNKRKQIASCTGEQMQHLHLTAMIKCICNA